MQIKLYNNFIRFLARLAEVVISLLRTLKNNFSDLVVTFEEARFQRRSAVIKVFLVSVVVVLSGILELVGPGLTEGLVKGGVKAAVGKFALAPFIIKLRGKVKSKLNKEELESPEGKEIINELNKINRYEEKMESASTSDQYDLFEKIKRSASFINKKLEKLGKSAVNVFGSRPSSGDTMYSFGRSPDSRVWYKTKEKAFEASQPKKDKDYYKLLESPSPKYDEKKLRKLGPEYSRPGQQLAKLREASSKISQGGGEKTIRFRLPGYAEEALRGLTRNDKIKKLYDLRKELLENPRAFQNKYNIKTKDGIPYTSENI